MEMQEFQELLMLMCLDECKRSVDGKALLWQLENTSGTIRIHGRIELTVGLTKRLFLYLD